jgi:mRNA-degrading endonuclease RelE of RelBE toxin-antitoxin system
LKRLVLEDQDAADFFRALAPAPKKALRHALERLREDPSGKKHGLDVKSLEGQHAQGLRRLRVGKVRVIFAVKGDVIRVTRIMHRPSGYDWLDEP